MPKNILFLADGTWNSPDQDEDHDGLSDPTNVVKLFGLLSGHDDVGSLGLQSEQERTLTEGGEVLQVAKYLHGVGDSRNWLVRVLGGVFGAGLVTRIARGYTFISRHYEPGDRIVLVGFSRGAYTVRALAGMITGQGLLDRQKVDCDDRRESYRVACAAWEQYRWQRLDNAQTRPFQEMLRDLPSFVRSDVSGQLTAPVEVHCVAVWDTVGALGIPLYDQRDSRIDSLQFCDCRLGKGVRRGYHAVAIDELRADFTPTLWEPRDGIVQMLFAGAHSDVGGGYPMANGESELAHVSLQWMHAQLLAEGVLMADRLPDVYTGSAMGGSHQPWLSPVWKRAARSFEPWADKGLQIHDSVSQRLGGAGPYKLYPEGENPRYRPANLPA